MVRLTESEFQQPYHLSKPATKEQGERSVLKRTNLANLTETMECQQMNVVKYQNSSNPVQNYENDCNALLILQRLQDKSSSERTVQGIPCIHCRISCSGDKSVSIF